MKAIIISFLLFLSGIMCYAQKNNDSAFLSANAYRQKAKSQRVAAGALGITGILLITGTTIYALDHLFEENKGLEIPFFMGCVFTVGSIPFIIASDRNYKKAKKLSTSFILQPTPPLIIAIKSTICYPSIAIKINL